MSDPLGPERPFLRPPIVESLELEALEPGRMHRLRVAMTQNASGNETLVPTFVLRSGKEGPVVWLSSAIHGNELNGIPVVHGIMEALAAQPALLRQGSIIGVPILNIPGYLAFSRQFEDGVDLNRIMPGVANGNESQLYAHRIVDRFLRHADVLIDLHTASFGRVNSFYVRADLSDPRVDRMARRLDPQIILQNANSDGTLRGAAARAGVAAITVEVGNPNIIQGRMVREVEQGIRLVLADLGMLDPLEGEAAEGEVVVCSGSRWMYTDRGGLLRVRVGLTELVEEGQVVASLKNAWGDTVREYRAPHRAIVIGHSTNPAARAGSRIVHLGEVAS